MQRQSTWVEVPGSRRTSAFANTREVCIFSNNVQSIHTDVKPNTEDKSIVKPVADSTNNKK